MASLEDSRPEAIWKVGAELGEGPVWVERDRALWFVDIKRQKIHRFDPASADKKSWNAPEQIGFLLPAASGGFVAGMQSGLHRFDALSGSFSKIVDVEAHLPGNRINDGTVDPSGRLWFGTMDNQEESATGCFYRFEDGRHVEAELPKITITNGPVHSPDGRILYHVDTLAQTIQACDVAEDGTLGPSRPFVRIGEGEGFPDGPTVDAEGCVWVGLYFGWEARRYSPAGELIGRVRFPTSNITKVAFGGPDLKTLYATSAQQGLKPDALAEQPEAGSLFAVDLDVPGLPGSLIAL
ncbi:SMP-30/gluconolactonase/LRE family protein [Sphingosinicella sp. BN140058]|nr:SMP-30/gluconolactonase/LRE family protein [Sphingosinicella sp. BN140058]